MSEEIIVLLVDDEPTFCELAVDLLEDADDGFDVQTETDVRSALDATLDDPGKYDAIVCDYKMPGTDGFDFYQTLQSEGIDLPYFIFTNKGDQEIASVSIKLGVTDYISKSKEPERYIALANRIRNAVEYHRFKTKWEDHDGLINQLVENDPDGVLIHDSEKIVHVNDRFADIAGAIRRHQIINREPDEVIEIDGLDSATWNESVEYEWRGGTLYDVGGDPMPVQVALLDVPYDGERAYRITVRPVDGE